MPLSTENVTPRQVFPKSSSCSSWMTSLAARLAALKHSIVTSKIDSEKQSATKEESRAIREILIQVNLHVVGVALHTVNLGLATRMFGHTV
ncbi:hypothetical protein CROQUDRAFT_106903 [Cronartium quercuum f. sp. fusiforme G11]|uniref:Uncharacterized protein n=1 Tax=Cronartium quercuum f. sp. fusiforme G11 TaxID=708437 RepID=A0A9P6TBY2_9BASI|nr:hypothetical protein CROQUDRAFT_106903 [Cronartium quercuum f. sp. fusiforme G11]